MSAFALVVRFQLKTGHEAAFDALVSKTVEGIQQHEPGTLVYVNHQVEGDPSARVFYELYADRAAFDAHEDQPHTKHFLTARHEHVESYTVDRLTPAVAAGIDLQASR